MIERSRWPATLAILCLVCVAGPVYADTAGRMLLAAQDEPDEAEAERIRNQDRKARREQSESEVVTRDRDRQAVDPEDGDAAADGKHRDGDDRRAPGEIAGAEKPGGADAAGRGRGNEVSEQMLERRDERKAIMEDDRESGDKVSGKKPWYKDEMAVGDEAAERKDDLATDDEGRGGGRGSGDRGAEGKSGQDKGQGHGQG